MNNYYTECEITYSGNDEVEIMRGSHYLGFTFTEKNKVAAKIKAQDMALKEFNKDVNCGFTDIKVRVAVLYETSFPASMS